MLKNNPQLFNLYVGYDDGSFLEMDAIDGAGRETRARLEAPEQAAFRMVVISRSDPAQVTSRRLFLSEKLKPSGNCRVHSTTIRASAPGTRTAFAATAVRLTGPYVFFATGKHGLHRAVRR